MARDGLPPRFKPWSPPKPPRLERQRNAGRWRNSPRDRGYDADWDALSLAFRERNPFCRFCQQEGLEGLTAVVDHIKPAREYPELRRDWNNLQGLCKHHHDVTKAKMEHYARRNGMLEQLPFWCAALENRPVQFRPGAIDLAKN